MGTSPMQTAHDRIGKARPKMPSEEIIMNIYITGISNKKERTELAQLVGSAKTRGINNFSKHLIGDLNATDAQSIYALITRNRSRAIHDIKASPVRLVGARLRSIILRMTAAGVITGRSSNPEIGTSSVENHVESLTRCAETNFSVVLRVFVVVDHNTAIGADFNSRLETLSSAI